MAPEARPRYRYGKVPAGLFTRTQLAQRGLKPSGPACGYLYLQGRHRNVELFPVAAAVPKRQPSDGQRAALSRGRQSQQAQRDAIKEVKQRARDEREREADEYRRQSEEALRDRIGRDFAASIEAAKFLLALGEGAVILDCETTGTDCDLEIVEVGVVDLAGAELFHSLVKPRRPIPIDAQRVHGITDAEVASAPSFALVWPGLRPILAGRTVVAFNASFDRGALTAELARLMLDQVGEGGERRKLYFAEGDEIDPECLGRAVWRCAMQLYAEHIGDWSRRHCSYTWHPLPGGGHRSVADCRATLALLRSMAGCDPRPLGPVGQQDDSPHGA